MDESSNVRGVNWLSSLWSIVNLPPLSTSIGIFCENDTFRFVWFSSNCLINASPWDDNWNSFKTWGGWSFQKFLKSKSFSDKFLAIALSISSSRLFLGMRPLNLLRFNCDKFSGNAIKSKYYMFFIKKRWIDSIKMLWFSKLFYCCFQHREGRHSSNWYLLAQLSEYLQYIYVKKISISLKYNF